MSEEGAHWSAGLQAEPGAWSPPPELVAWAQPYKTPERAWSRCKSAEWLLWALAHTGADHPTLVLSACDCARLVLHQARGSDGRPLEAIEGAEAWARGERSRKELDVLCEAIAEACEDARREERGDRAALAALCVLSTVMDPHRASSVATQVVWALGRGMVRRHRWDRTPTPHKETRAIEAKLVELVRSRPHPLLQPDLHARSRARSSLQVAWDLLAERMFSESTELGVVPQLCSWWTARSLGLDPAAEMERALAQRLQLVPELGREVAAILESAGSGPTGSEGPR